MFSLSTFLKTYIINSITKSYILNIKIRPLVTEYALMIKLVDGTSSTHSFNRYAYFGHSWSYFDIQNLRLVILYLLGHLNFASRVILPGRAFVTNLYKLMPSVKEAYHYVHLNKECKADLQMWLEYLTHWNGINLFYENELTKFMQLIFHCIPMRHLQLALVDFSKTNNSMTDGRKNCQKVQIIVLPMLFLNCIR